MFNEPLILSLCGVVRERLLSCRVVVGWVDCIVYKKEQKKNAWWKRRGKERKTKQHFLKRKRRQKMSASNETKPLSRCSLTFFASSFFSESVVVLFFSLFLFFSTMRSIFSIFLSLFFISLVYWPFRTRLLACLIRAAILHFSFRLHLSSVVLISDLPYQSAAFIFLDGSRVSEGYLELDKIHVSYG